MLNVNLILIARMITQSLMLNSTMSKYLGGGMDGGEVGEGEQNKEGMEIDGLRGLYHSLGMEIAKGFLIQGVTL